MSENSQIPVFVNPAFRKVGKLAVERHPPLTGKFSHDLHVIGTKKAVRPAKASQTA
jgi:hypothetical protein